MGRVMEHGVGTRWQRTVEIRGSRIHPNQLNDRAPFVDGLLSAVDGINLWSRCRLIDDRVGHSAGGWYLH